MPVVEQTERVRTTVRLPRPLYEEARCFVNKDLVPAETVNDFIVAAILAYIKLIKRKQIDAAFAGMAEDPDYQKEAELIAEEFANSDWEALLLTEEDAASD